MPYLHPWNTDEREALLLLLKKAEEAICDTSAATDKRDERNGLLLSIELEIVRSAIRNLTGARAVESQIFLETAEEMTSIVNGVSAERRDFFPEELERLERLEVICTWNRPPSDPPA